MNQQPEQPSVRRIVLPSGRSIEVVRFNDTTHVDRGLHVCPDCSSGLVQPVDWSEAPDDCWNLVLSCPNCDWYTEGLYNADQVRELEDRLDEGLADMLRDLQRLTQANMADQIDRFVNALNADQILPEDF
ncbi:MAG: HNH endonuclease signature motif containing protein [Solirubrobacteraceae bacterium]